MSLALLFLYLMLNMFRMLIHPSSGACNLFVELFRRFISLVRCVLVLRCGLAGVVWCGIRMEAEALVLIISLFNAQHISDVYISILGSLRLIC